MDEKDKGEMQRAALNFTKIPSLLLSCVFSKPALCDQKESVILGRGFSYKFTKSPSSPNAIGSKATEPNQQEYADGPDSFAKLTFVAFQPFLRMAISSHMETLP